MTATSKSASATLRLLAAAIAVGALTGCASAPPAGDRFASLDRTRVRYDSHGTGREAIVLIHGWSGAASTWQQQVPALAARYRVLALDLPGHGGSDKPQTPYTMDYYARAVDAVMRDAGVDRGVLVGFSMGTPVMRQFYRLYPQKTLALVSVDGALKNMYSGMLDPLIAQLRGPGYRDAAGKFIASMFPNPGTETLRDATVATAVATPQHVMVGSFEGMLDPSIWKDDPISVPLLVVNSKSPYWTAEYEQYVRKLAPQVEFRMIEGPGHFLMLEKPDEFNAVLLEFLRKNQLLGG
jgi:sigma-B regulation protein RsbQ